METACCGLIILNHVRAVSTTLFLPHGATAPSGPGPPYYQSFTITLRHITFVGLLWTSDQPEPQTSTLQHTTLTRDNIHATGGIRIRTPTKRAAAEPRLRPRGHWDRLHSTASTGIKQNSRKVFFLEDVRITIYKLIFHMLAKSLSLLLIWSSIIIRQTLRVIKVALCIPTFNSLIDIRFQNE
jgi:hypothetical protein